MSDTANNTNPLTEAFETTVCGRCGGCGQHSYCQMYGTTCFGCSGKGKVYTKRAHAAMAYATTLRTVKAQDVQVGWLLFDSGGPFTKAGWFTVTEVGLGGSNSYSVAQDGTRTAHYNLTTKQCVHGVFLDSEVQAVPNKARLAEVRALALAYQATLTKAGTVAPAGYFEAEAKREAKRAAKAEAARIAYEADQAARAVTQAAERAAAEAAAAEAQAQADARAAELEAARAAERAKSQYVGTVGERREFTITCEFTVKLQAFGYGWVAPVLYGCRDAEGNRIVYKGSASFLRKGETGTVLATIKEHREYKGEAQTVLTRPKLAREAETEPETEPEAVGA